MFQRCPNPGTWRRIEEDSSWTIRVFRAKGRDPLCGSTRTKHEKLEQLYESIGWTSGGVPASWGSKKLKQSCPIAGKLDKINNSYLNQANPVLGGQQTFLCAPCTSVESKRLFSTVPNTVDEKRNRLTADSGEMNVFMTKNLPLLLVSILSNMSLLHSHTHSHQLLYYFILEFKHLQKLCLI